MTIWNFAVAVLAVIGAVFLFVQGVNALALGGEQLKRHYHRKAVLAKVALLMKRRKLYREVMAEIRRISALGHGSHDKAAGFGWWQESTSEHGAYGDTLTFDVSKMGLTLNETRLIAGLLDKRRGDEFDRFRGPTAWLPRGRRGYTTKSGYRAAATVYDPLVSVKHAEFSGVRKPWLVA